MINVLVVKIGRDVRIWCRNLFVFDVEQVLGI